jgi:hypothetical protein
MNKRLLLFPPLILAASWWLFAPEPAEPVSVVQGSHASAAERPTAHAAPRRLLPWRPEAAEDSGEPLGDAPLAIATRDDTGDTGDTGAAVGPPLITARLVDAKGNPVDFGMIVSPECDIWVWGGGPYPTTFTATEGLCAFQGRRRDGLLWGRSEWIDLELVSGETYELELVVPIERTGGLGVMILEHEFGIEVQQVWPGTPAAEMGLAAGDIITEVDGLPSATLTMDEFIQVMTGPVGTDVNFALAYEEDTGFTEEEITLTRAWLE